METERICSNCRKPLPPDVPLGLCPECLIKSGFPTETGPEEGGIGRFVPPPVEEIARLFPQFEILGFIGKGGMGAVYKARQPALDRMVALKVLPPAVASDPGFAERFNREARALARLSHPNIVVVYDFGKAGPLHYLVMEFVDGTNLREVERAGRLSPEQALAIVPQICEALQFAHNEGIVHRDVKPENLLLDKKGRVKITDFGIAKILGVSEGKAALTGAKEVMGTPHYMAPEQIEKPQEVDHRADIYSLGVVFYEMLTGELPLGKFAPPSRKVQVDVRLDEVVLHTLEKEPERRYQQASQIKTDVETIAGTPRPMAAAAAMPAGAPPVMPAPAPETVSDKILLPTFLLAFFFGVFGAHRFYVGKIGTGVLQLFTLGGFGVWTTIDWILILCKVFTDGNGRRITNWWHPPSGPPKPAKPPRPPRPQSPPVIGGNLFGQIFAGTAPVIIAPAFALMIAGFTKVIGLLLVLVAGWPSSGVGHFLVSRAGIFSPFHDGPLFGVGNVLFAGAPAAVMIYGATEMMRCRSYAWSVAASLVGIVFCSTLGFPAGTWALIILLLPGVRNNFANAPAPIATENWLKIFGGAGAASLLIFLIMSLAGLLYDSFPSTAGHRHVHAAAIRSPDAANEPQHDQGQSLPARPTNTPAAPAMPALPVSAPGLPAPTSPAGTPAAPTAPLMPVHPARSPAPPTDAQKQILQVQLNEALLDLTNMQAQYSIGRATSEAVDSVRDKVDILKAELTGDPVQVAQVKLAAAQRKLGLETQLYNVGRISSGELAGAKAGLVMAQLQLKEAAVRPSTFMSLPHRSPAVAVTPVFWSDNRMLNFELNRTQSELTNAEALNKEGRASSVDVDSLKESVDILHSWLDGQVTQAVQIAKDRLTTAQRARDSLEIDKISADDISRADDAVEAAHLHMLMAEGAVEQATAAADSAAARAKVAADVSNSVEQAMSQSVLVSRIGEKTSSFNAFEVGPAGKLAMNVDRGDVRIKATDGIMAIVRVTRKVTGAGGREATNILKDEQVVLKQNGNDISITAQNPPELQDSSFFNHPNLETHYEITLPRQFDVHTATSGGNVTVSGIQGSTDVETAGGEMTVSNIKGSVHAETSGGDINASGIQGSADVRTSGGRIICDGISGDLNARTSGGDVRVTGSNGRLNLDTTGGSVTIAGFTGPGVQATTSGGSASAEFATAPTEDSELKSSGGNITVHLPVNAALQLEGVTSAGAAKSDFPVQIKDSFGNGTLSGAINGGGPVLRMETDAGDLEVMKN